MSRRSIPPHRLAAQRLPWHVILPERPTGWGYRLNELCAWCSARLPREAWFTYGAAFYFAQREDAEAFAVEAGVSVGRDDA